MPLIWLFTQLDIDKEGAEYLKKRFEDFEDCESLEERFDALLESYREVSGKSLWITKQKKHS